MKMELRCKTEDPKGPVAAPGYEHVALVLQGGGALGAYQAGVYRALEELALRPNWVAGISIGAVNAAIIAGSPPDLRVSRLEEFWRSISLPLWWPWSPTNASLRLGDGTSFIHVVTVEDDTSPSPLLGVDAFARFQVGIADRREEQPVAVDATVVGSYGFDIGP
jgi:predicted acylesterase/phospholipase RssA